MSTPEKTGSTHDFSSDSEDELDWEEVAVPQPEHLAPEDQAEPCARLDIEVTLDAYPARGKDGKQYEVLPYLVERAC